MQEEEIDEWTLSIDELSFVLDHREEIHFAMAVVLKHLQLRGAYPGEAFVLDKEIIEYLSQQVHRSRKDYDAITWTDRRMRRLHEKARIFLGLRHPGEADRKDLRAWLEIEILPTCLPHAEALKRARRWFASNRLFEPGSEFLQRIVRSARKDFEDAYLKEVYDNLDPVTCRILEESLAFPDRLTGFASLKAAPGKAAMAAFRDFAERLKFVRGLGLPRTTIEAGGEKLQKLIRRRVVHDDAWEMRRRSETRRIAMYAIYLHDRRKELTDTLVELLIETTHQIVSRSERRVAAQFLGDIKRIAGKETLLADIAEAAITNPNGAVSSVIFPVASEKKLKAIIKERRAKGEWQRRIFDKIRGSYAGHYRGMSRIAFEAFDFQSHNNVHRPVINAIAILRNLPPERRILSHLDRIPIKGVVPPKWAGFVEYEGAGDEDETRGYRISRVDYEICVLVALRQALRSKEIFVDGAERYCDPDRDVPQDFSEARPRYYAELHLHRDASRFTAELMRKWKPSYRRSMTADQTMTW